MRVLVFSALAVLGSACGVNEDEVVKLKEGESLSDAPECSFAGCADENPNDGRAPFCAELFLEFGRSPPLCIYDDIICQRLECANPNKRCAVFGGFPGQVKCID